MQTTPRALRRTATAVLAVSAAISLAACSASSPASSKDTTLRVAYFASATANGFSNAVWKGIGDEAKKLGGDIKLTELDGQFNATTQFSQAQDAASSGQYDGAVVLMNDTVGSVPAVAQMISAKIAVSNVLNPLGPNLHDLKSQVPGLYNVIADPAYDTTLQANDVVKYCQKLDPCRVVVLIGGLQFPFDKARNDAYHAVLDKHPNIKILATGEAGYDRDKAVTTMSDILQAHPQFDVLLSATDQETLGAQVSLTQAGYDLKSRIAAGTFYINSLGGAKEGVAAVRAGEWNETVGNFPYTAGRLALKQVVQKLRGGKPDQDINLDKAAPVPLVLTKEVLDKHPDFTGEWSG